MKNVLIIFCVLYVVGVKRVSGNCNDLRTFIYDELNCKPHHPPDQSCPSHYINCDYNLPQGGCRFRGLYYGIGEVLEEEYTGAHGRCECRRQKNDTQPSIVCSALDCPEFLRDIRRDCYLTYKNHKFCATGEACPPFDTNVCRVDGEIYRKGERFYPKGMCLQCVCDSGFTGRYTTQHCRKRTCGFEIDHAEQISKHCAPVYRKTEFCCPSTWTCHDGSEKIMKPNSTDYRNNNRRHQRAVRNRFRAPQQNLCPQSQRKILQRDYSHCRFEYLTLGIGDYFEKLHNSMYIRCSCTTPPLLTCIVVE